MHFGQIRFRGVPVEAWLTLPIIVLLLYAAFRWRKFGEDPFTWNHNYFQLACAFGGAVWVASFITKLLPETWHVVVFWTAAFIIAVLALSYWNNQELVSAAVISALLVLVGVIAMPLPRIIRTFLFGPPPVAESIRDHPGYRSFNLNLPEPWRQIEGKSPRTFSRGQTGSGLLQVSLQPPLEKPFSDGTQIQGKLSELLDEIGKEMPLGEQTALSHEQGAAGMIAFADYRSPEHGPMRFWLIPAEVTVFASYTDGAPDVAQGEIAEAHEALKRARFAKRP